MKLVHISDTHQERMYVPNGDILIHSGDATSLGTVPEILKFKNWFNALPHKHKLFVPGNHDWLFQKNESLAREIMENTIVLIDEEITIDGVKFYGTPWTPMFFNWAFMKDDLELMDVFQNIPEDINVLITHGPPKN